MAIAEPGNFFKQKRTASEIKAEILPQYFSWWLKNRLNPSAKSSENLLLMDLQAGPGYDPEDVPQAPILLLQHISKSNDSESDLNQAVQTYFYDSSEALLNQLQENILNLSFYESLGNPPVIIRNPEEQITLLEQVKQKHALIAFDPFTGSFAGKILTAAQPAGKADLFMVFSYSKMRQTVLAPETNEDIRQLFGNALNQIKEYDQKEKSAKKREQFLVKAIETALQNQGYFTFKFKINLPGKDQTSHYIIVSASDINGYLTSKELFCPYSELQEDGVPTFTVNQKEQPPLLPGFFRFISEYCQENLITEIAQNKSRFHYKTLGQIYAEHSLNTHYIKNNYKAALLKLMEMGHINLVDINNKKVKQITDETVVFYKLHVSKK